VSGELRKDQRYEPVDHGRYILKTNVDGETLQANLHRTVEATTIRVYQDPDGFEFIEQSFDDGSKVLMHTAQFEAITCAAVNSPAAVARFKVEESSVG
jgi:hypothetical protein